jgi:hypothetical protein
MATFALGFAKDKLIDYAKEELMQKLTENLNKGDAGIDALFIELKNSLVNSTVLQTILGGICKINQAEEMKTELKTKIDKIDFSKELEELKNKMPGITEEIKQNIDTLPDKLKTKLKDLIDDIITCNTTSAPVTGGSKQRDLKKKRRQRKTKKRIHKRSRGRKQHSRK